MGDFEYDFFEDILSKPMKGFNNKTMVYPDYGELTDDELLDLPSHEIAARIRSAALDGKELVIGDPCSNVEACLRIPDRDTTQFDYTPKLNWRDYAPLEYDSIAEVNMDLGNKALPFRVMEPKLPAVTKVTAYEATCLDVDLSLVETCIVKANVAVQIVRMAGGDYVELAELLSKCWDKDGLIDPYSTVDFVGNIKLARLIARTTATRFQFYRNVGWTSIVDAGLNQAQTSNYGVDAIVNWQRRTELAKAHVHTAIILEGGNLKPQTEYQMTCRVPAFSVQHVIFEDLALRVDPSKFSGAKIPNLFLEPIEMMMPDKLRTTFKKLSQFIYARHDVEIDDSTMLAWAALYDRMVFAQSLSFKPVNANNNSDQQIEVAQKMHITRAEHYAAATKAHDPFVAFVEALWADVNMTGHLYGPVVSVLSALKEIMHARSLLVRNEHYAFINYIMPVIAQVKGAVRSVIERMFSNSAVKMREKMSNYIECNMPKDLTVGDDGELDFIRYFVFYLLNITASSTTGVEIQL
jgi:hypothetical protein